MIGLDTNVVVRLLTQDHPEQYEIARTIVEKRLTASEPGYISLAVVLETAWVLQNVYEYSGPDVAAALKALLADPALSIEAEQEVLIAALALEENGAPFEDSLISALAMAAGCSVTFTFDRKAARLPGFELAK